jgi:hypothetical protein
MAMRKKKTLQVTNISNLFFVNEGPAKMSRTLTPGACALKLTSVVNDFVPQ